MAGRESSSTTAASIPALESALLDSAKSGTCNAKSNRALLKLYQEFPERLSIENVILVLLKALAALPDPDFLLAMYLLPEAVQSHESVVLLAELERHLQLGQFSAYWTKSKLPAARTLLDRVANINDSIREFVAVVVARTYQKIGANVLAQELDLPDAAAFASAHGWTADGNSFVLPAVVENMPRAKRVGDEIKYSEVAGVIATLSR